MTKQKYQGRHRGQATASSDESPVVVVSIPSAESSATAAPMAAPPREPGVDPVSSRAARGRDVTPAVSSGRHRAPSTHSIPRLAGTGVLLPTAATATIVLTTTGAHLGGAPVVSAVIAAPAAGTASSQPDDGSEAKSLMMSLQQRSAQSRSARATPRTPTTTTTPSSTPSADPAEVAARAEAAMAAKAASALAAAHRWVTPLDVSYTLTSGFGMRWGSMHPGQDFAVPVGSPIKAMSSGTVIFAGWSGGYGNKVEIRYWDGTISWYAHNSRLQVTKGETVTPGEVVALSGNTGHSTGPHSHIEIHLDGDDTSASAVPPIPWLTTHGNMPGRSSSAGSPGATD